MDGVIIKRSIDGNDKNKLEFASKKDNDKNMQIIMEIEVKFGKGRCDQVVVHFGDDPTELAKQFVARHGLKVSSVPIIAQYLSSTIEEFLTNDLNNDEDDSSDYESDEDSQIFNNTEQNSNPNILQNSNPDFNASQLSENILYISELSNSERENDVIKKNASNRHSINSFERKNSNSRSNSITTKEFIPIDRSEKKETNQYIKSLPNKTHEADTLVNNSISKDFSKLNSNIPSPSRNESKSRSLSPSPARAKNHVTVVSNSRNNLLLTNKPEPLGSFHQLNTIQIENNNNIPIVAVEESKEANINDTLQWISNDAIVQNMLQNDFSNTNLPTDLTFSSNTYEPITREELNTNVEDILPSDDVTNYDEDKYTSFYSVSESEYSHRYQDNDTSYDDELNNSNLQLSEEEMYENLKMNWKNSSGNGTDSISVWNSNLKPSSKIMYMGNSKNLSKNALNKQKISNGNNTRSLVGKSVNERLFISAEITNNKRSSIAQQKEKALDKQLTDNKFKLNSASKNIVSNLRVRNDADVHSRLHNEGLKEKKLKEKRVEEMKELVKSEDWSCAKCGLFHKISTSSITIRPLNYTGGLSKQEDKNRQKICSNCGWNQGEVQPFKPVNIGITLLEDDDIKNEIANNSTSKLKKDSIYNYLYENAKQRDNILKLNQVLFDRSLYEKTFQPSIPESSKEIINNNTKNNNSNTSKPTTSNVISGTVINEYFSKSATDRLSTTKLRSDIDKNTIYKETKSWENSLNEVKNHHSKFQQLDYNNINNQHPKSVPEKVDRFVNRLTYEYKEKNDRIKEKQDLYTNYDDKTGQPLYRPVIPINESNEVYYEGIHRTDVFDDILRKDEKLKQKRSLDQVKAIEKQQLAVANSKVKASETSEMILKNSRERHIEELYRLLYTSTSEEELSFEGEADMSYIVSQMLDLSLINHDVMVPEVNELLYYIKSMKEEELKLKLEKGEIREDNEQNLSVGFQEFRLLALKAIKKRSGPGRAYICAPKKKPDVAMQMILKEIQEETFHPSIDKNSKQMAGRHNKDVPIEDILYREGERLRSKVESARRDKYIKESEKYTFRPQLFKTPSYITPKYRGMKIDENSNNISTTLLDEEKEQQFPSEDLISLSYTSLHQTQDDVIFSEAVDVSFISAFTVENIKLPYEVEKAKEFNTIIIASPIRQKEENKMDLELSPSSPCSNHSEDSTIDTISTKFSVNSPDKVNLGYSEFKTKSSESYLETHLKSFSIGRPNKDPVIQPKSPLNKNSVSISKPLMSFNLPLLPIEVTDVKKEIVSRDLSESPPPPPPLKDFEVDIHNNNNNVERLSIGTALSLKTKSNDSDTIVQEKNKKSDNDNVSSKNNNKDNVSYHY